MKRKVLIIGFILLAILIPQKVSALDTYTTNCEFTPIDNYERFTYYDEVDNKNGFFDCSFKTGDEITITYSDNSSKTLTYNEYNWEENGIYVENMDNIPYIDISQTANWNAGNEYDVIVTCGIKEDKTPYEQKIATATILENPISQISFTPSLDSPLDRFTYYEGETEYDAFFISGDILTVTQNGVQTNYTYIDGEFSNNGKVLSERFGEPSFQEVNTSEWTAGEKQTIIVQYAGKECTGWTINVKSLPFESIVIKPLKTSYTTAEMKLLEDISFDYQYDDEGLPIMDGDEQRKINRYTYRIPYKEGDSLTLINKDSSQTKYTYSEKQSKFIHENEPLEKDMAELDWELNNGENPISAGEHIFKASYRGIETTVTIIVTEATDDESALANYKTSAANTVSTQYGQIDWSNYKDAQQDEAEVIYRNTLQAIKDAQSIAEIDEIINDFTTNIATIKTKDQMDEEEQQIEIASVTYSGGSAMKNAAYPGRNFNFNDNEILTFTTTTNDTFVYKMVNGIWTNQTAGAPELISAEIAPELGYANTAWNNTFNYRVRVMLSLANQNRDFETPEYTAYINVMEWDTIDNLSYAVSEENTVALYASNSDALASTTALTIPEKVTLADGKTYNVTKINTYALGGLSSLTSITIPESVTEIENYALGYTIDEWEYNEGWVPKNAIKNENLTVYGKPNSTANSYATANQFTFEDLSSSPEPDNPPVDPNPPVNPNPPLNPTVDPTSPSNISIDYDWVGKYSGSIPNTKSAKARVTKNKIKVSWKKLSKKQLKKFDKIEVQISTSKDFTRSTTTRKYIKKSKKSYTTKNMKKGTYYVRVRNIKGSGSNKIVSKWSKTKIVRIKAKTTNYKIGVFIEE